MNDHATGTFGSLVDVNGVATTDGGTQPDGGTLYTANGEHPFAFELYYNGNGNTGSYGTGSSGNDIVLAVTVPEPTSLSLIGLGALSLLTARRPRRKPRTAD